MLILSRKEGESIKIGDNIVISVVDISKGIIKLGIDAPQDTMILRSELEIAVEEANLKANKHISDDLLKGLSGRFEK